VYSYYSAVPYDCTAVRSWLDLASTVQLYADGPAAGLLLLMLRLPASCIPHAMRSQPQSTGLGESPRSDSSSADELSAAGNFQRPRASSQASKAISGRCRHWPVDWVVHRHTATACPHLLPVLRLREKVRSQPSPPPARACRVQVSVLDGVLAPRPGLRRPKGLAFPPPSPRAVRQDG
jgi:hypothetical protein